MNQLKQENPLKKSMKLFKRKFIKHLKECLHKEALGFEEKTQFQDVMVGDSFKWKGITYIKLTLFAGKEINSSNWHWFSPIDKVKLLKEE